MQSISESGGLALVEAAGISWVRRNAVLWSDIETTEGVYDWSKQVGLEQELIAASRSNLRVILIVRSAPAWAQSIEKTPCGPIRPEKLAAFANFMNALVKRYGAPPYSVKYWELWNEPDVAPELFDATMRETAPFGCYGDADDPYYGGEAYGEMLNTVYPAIKAADSDAVVMNGGLLLDCDPRNSNVGCAARTPPSDPVPARFLEGMLRAGAGKSFDILSFHAYDIYRNERGAFGMGGFNGSWDTTGSVVHNKAAYVRSILGRFGLEDKPLFNTEAGLACGAPAICESDFERTAANHIAAVFAAAAAERLVGQCIYSTQSTWFSTNLLKADLKPRAAFTALAVARQQFGRAQFVRYVTNRPGFKIYELQEKARRFWVVLPQTKDQWVLNLPDDPATIRDALGAMLPVSRTVETNGDILYIDWP